MKTATLLLVLIFGLALVSQTANYYDDSSVLLVGSPSSGEGVAMMVTKDGSELLYVPISDIKYAVDSGDKPVRLGDLRAFITQLSTENDRLRTENERLWKVVEKQPSNQPPVTVNVQPSPQISQEDAAALRRQILLRSLIRQPSPTINVNIRDCTRFPALCVN